MAIPDYMKKNFAELLSAAKKNDVVLMECTDRKTGEPRFVLCAVNYTPGGPDGEYECIPLGCLSVDPYDEYVSPKEKDECGEQRESQA